MAGHTRWDDIRNPRSRNRPPVVVGVTGSRNGFQTEFQQKQVTAELYELKSGGAELFVHGDCVGVDKNTAAIAAKLGYRVEPLPGQAGSFLARNREIVGRVDIMIGVPNRVIDLTAEWEPGDGGTAYTMRYTRRQNVPLVAVWPAFVERIGESGAFVESGG